MDIAELRHLYPDLDREVRLSKLYTATDDKYCGQPKHIPEHDWEAYGG